MRAPGMEGIARGRGICRTSGLARRWALRALVRARRPGASAARGARVSVVSVASGARARVLCCRFLAPVSYTHLRAHETSAHL
eukprot:7810614-Alexandrium_andersonii.AAC.1